MAQRITFTLVSQVSLNHTIFLYCMMQFLHDISTNYLNEFVFPPFLHIRYEAMRHWAEMWPGSPYQLSHSLQEHKQPLSVWTTPTDGCDNSNADVVLPGILLYDTIQYTTAMHRAHNIKYKVNNKWIFWRESSLIHLIHSVQLALLFNILLVRYCAGTHVCSLSHTYTHTREHGS